MKQLHLFLALLVAFQTSALAEVLVELPVTPQSTFDDIIRGIELEILPSEGETRVPVLDYFLGGLNVLLNGYSDRIDASRVSATDVVIESTDEDLLSIRLDNFFVRLNFTGFAFFFNGVQAEYAENQSFLWDLEYSNITFSINRQGFEQQGHLNVSCLGYVDFIGATNVNLSPAFQFTSLIMLERGPDPTNEDNPEFRVLVAEGVCSKLEDSFNELLPSISLGETPTPTAELAKELLDSLSVDEKADLVPNTNGTFIYDILGTATRILNAKNDQGDFIVNSLLAEVLDGEGVLPTNLDPVAVEFGLLSLNLTVHEISASVELADTAAVQANDLVSYGATIPLSVRVDLRFDAEGISAGRLIWEENDAVLSILLTTVTVDAGLILGMDEKELFELVVNQVIADPLNCVSSICKGPVEVYLTLDLEDSDVGATNLNQLPELVDIAKALLRMVELDESKTIVNTLIGAFDINGALFNGSCPEPNPVLEVVPNTDNLVVVDRLNDALGKIANQAIGDLITELDGELVYTRYEKNVFDVIGVDEVFAIGENEIVTGLFDYLNNNFEESNCTAFDLLNDVLDTFASSIVDFLGESNGNVSSLVSFRDGAEDNTTFTLELSNNTSLRLAVQEFSLIGLDFDNIFEIITLLAFPKTTIGIEATLESLQLKVNASAVFINELGVEDDPVDINLSINMDTPELALAATLPVETEVALDSQFGSLFMDLWKCLLSIFVLPPAFAVNIAYERFDLFESLFNGIAPLVPKLLETLGEDLPTLIVNLIRDEYSNLVDIIAIIETNLGVHIGRLLSYLLDRVVLEAIVNGAVAYAHDDAICIPPDVIPDSDNTFNFVTDETFHTVVELVETCVLDIVNTELLPTFLDDNTTLTLFSDESVSLELNEDNKVDLWLDVAISNVNTIHDVVLMETFPTISDYLVKNGLAAGEPQTPLTLIASVDYTVNDGARYGFDVELSIEEISAYLTLLLEFNRNRVNSRELRDIANLNCWIGDLHTAGLRELLLGAKDILLRVTCRECEGNDVLTQFAEISGTAAATEAINEAMTELLSTVQGNLLTNLETFDAKFIESARAECSNSSSEFVNEPEEPIEGALELVVFLAGGGLAVGLFLGCARAYRGKADSETTHVLHDSLLTDLHMDAGSMTKIDKDDDQSDFNVHQLRVELVEYLMAQEEERTNQQHVEELIQWTLAQDGEETLEKLKFKMKEKYGNELSLSDKVFSKTGGSSATLTEQDQTSSFLPTTSWDYRDTAPLCFHPAIPTWARLLVPVSFLVNIAFFISGDLQQGARVDLLLSLVGSAVNVENFKTFSLANSVVDLWNAGAYPLALLIALLSGAWPYMKILLMSYAWFRRPAKLSLQARTKLLKTLDMLGKLALVEVFFLVLVLSTFRIRVLAPEEDFLPDDVYQLDILVTPIWGLYAFVIASILSLVVSNLMLAFDLELEAVRAHENEVRIAGSEERHQELVGNSYESVANHVFLISKAGYELRVTRFGQTLWLLMSSLFAGFLIWGAIEPAIFLDVTGILRNIMELAEDRVDMLAEVTREYSLGSLTTRLLDLIMDSADVGGAIGTTIVLIVFFCCTLLFPIARILYVAHGYVNNFTIRQTRGFLRNLEILSAWCGLEVFLVSVVVGVLEIGQISEFLLDNECTPLIPTLDLIVNDLGLIDYEGERLSCFRLRPTVKLGSFLLVGASIGSYLTVQIGMALIHGAFEQRLQQRMEILTRRDSSTSSNPMDKSGQINCAHSFVFSLHTALAFLGLVEIKPSARALNPRFSSIEDAEEKLEKMEKKKTLLSQKA